MHIPKVISDNKWAILGGIIYYRKKTSGNFMNFSGPFVGNSNFKMDPPRSWPIPLSHGPANNDRGVRSPYGSQMNTQTNKKKTPKPPPPSPPSPNPHMLDLDAEG